MGGRVRALERGSEAAAAPRIAAPLAELYRRRPHALHLLVLALVLAGCYGSSLGFEFVWDDNLLIVDNLERLRPGEWQRAFAGSFWDLHQSADPGRSFYRPVITLSYIADLALWDLRPFGFHLTNLLLYAVCTGLVYALALRLLGDAAAAALAALIYLVHPSHIENVAWISGRTDLFCALFFLAACLAFLAWAGSGRRSHLGLSLLAYALALLSKEMAITLPAVLCLLYAHLPRRDHPWRRLVLPLAAYALLSAGYLAARSNVLGDAVTVLKRVDPRLWIASLPMVFAKYVGLLSLLVAPDPHHPDGLVTSLSAAQVGQLAVGSAFLAWLIVNRRRRDAATLAAGWFGLTLLPVFNLGGFGDVLLADRFLNIPSIGLALLLGHGLVVTRAGRYRLPYTVAMATFVVLCGLVLRANLGYWQSDLTLFARAHETSPESAYVNMNLGRALAGAGQHEPALPLYQRAVALEPGNGLHHLQRGVSLESLGRDDEALVAYATAARLGYRNQILDFNLGNVLKRRGQLAAAAAAYRRSLRALDDHRVRNNLGELMLASGDLTGAERQFRRSLTMHASRIAHNNMAVVLMQLGDETQAATHLHQAIALEPDAATPHFNLARLLYGQGALAAADDHAATALQLLRRSGPAERLRAVEDELGRQRASAGRLETR